MKGRLHGALVVLSGKNDVRHQPQERTQALPGFDLPSFTTGVPYSTIITYYAYYEVNAKALARGLLQRLWLPCLKQDRRQPVGVVHCGCPVRIVEKYIENYRRRGESEEQGSQKLHERERITLVALHSLADPCDWNQQNWNPAC